MPHAVRFTEQVAHHGEGPFWDALSNRLYCIDVFGGEVVSVGLDRGVRRHPVPGASTTVIRRRAGSGFVLATGQGVLAADDRLTEFESLAELTTDATIRTNDGGCDPLGGFVVGTMACNEEPDRGAVYRVSPELGVTRLLAPVSISNGMQWSGDGGRVFYIDTPTRRVDVFNVDPATGQWSGRRTHVRIDASHGFPDGMAIDEDDGLWIALWGGGAVNHYDRTGQLVETIRVPGVTQVSSCVFGGCDQNVLFITTSRQGLSNCVESDAGAVFAYETSIRGAHQAEFAG